jgi:hypothetical protein
VHDRSRTSRGEIESKSQADTNDTKNGMSN